MQSPLFASLEDLLADPAVRQGLARLEGRGPAMVETTMDWSRINSGSREVAGLSRMANVLAEAFGSLAPVEAAPIGPSRRVTAAGAVEEVSHPPALRVSVRPQAPVQVALTGHFDTVFPASHPFQSPTLRPDGVLHGPGVADMKGGLVVMKEALEAFETLPFKDRLGFEVLLSPDEEIGSPASAPLLAEVGRRSQVGMTYEPGLPDGGLVNARKGSAIFALIVKGRAAHVGRAFEDGRSSVLAGAQAALALNALNGQRSGVTVNVGAIEGGGPVNVVPDLAVVRFNVRVPDEEAGAWALAEVDRIVAEVAGHDGIAVDLTGGFTRPPKPLTPAQERLVDWTGRLAQSLGQTVRFAPSGGVCEGNNLAAAGCPNIDTLGPCGGALHSEDEFAIAASFAPRAQLSFLMLAAFAAGVHDVRELRS